MQSVMNIRPLDNNKTKIIIKKNRKTLLNATTKFEAERNFYAAKGYERAKNFFQCCSV